MYKPLHAKIVGNHHFMSIISTLSVGKSAVGGLRSKGSNVSMGDLGQRAAGVGATAAGVKGMFSAGMGMKAVGKLAGAGAALGGEIAGLGTSAAGLFIESFSKKLGAGGDMFITSSGNTSFDSLNLY